MSETSNFYKYSAAVQGFALWASWAFYINSKVSLSAGITAGIIQGVFSFCSTLIVIALITKLYNHFNQLYLKLILPTCLMMCMLSFVQISAHAIANTPEILKTVAPPLFIATLFCAFTTYKLNK